MHKVHIVLQAVPETKPPSFILRVDNRLSIIKEDEVRDIISCLRGDSDSPKLSFVILHGLEKPSRARIAEYLELILEGALSQG